MWCIAMVAGLFCMRFKSKDEEKYRADAGKIDCTFIIRLYSEMTGGGTILRIGVALTVAMCVCV